VTDSYAVAAVTETLRAVLQPIVGSRVPGAQVDARPLDELANETGVRILNVFLYRVGVDAAHRNEDRFGLRPGEQAQPSLPLVLNYLLTPYVADDAENEVVGHQMLGAAMSRLHDQPLLRPSDIESAAPYSDLHEQVERVRITPISMSVDEISKLWTAFQTKYRISAAYEVRVVLIDSTNPAKGALPVLRRGTEDRGPDVAGTPESPFPALSLVVPPQQRDSALPGEEVVVEGVNLAGGSAVARLSHRSLEEPVDVPATLVSRTQAKFTVPNQPAGFPAGLWSVALVLTTDNEEQATNEVALPVGPRLSSSPLPLEVDRNAEGTAVINLTCTPQVRPGQRIALLVGDRQVVAAPITTATGSLTFTFRNAPEGRRRLRLRVDGVDSPLVDRSVTPPVFDDDQAVILT
jgi:hypothetical protein